MADNRLLATFRQPGGNAPLLTIPGGIGLYRDSIELSFGAEPGKGFSAQIQMRGVSLRIGANGDGLLEQLVPGTQDSQAFDLGLDWDSAKGLSFAGGTALEVTLPLKAKLPVMVRGVGRTFSGRYYVERVLHLIGSDSSYVQRFTLRRNATGLTGQENFRSDDALAS